MNHSVLKSRLSWGSLGTAVALLFLTSQPARAGDTVEFSPQAVFTLPDRANIDSRCKDANFHDNTKATGSAEDELSNAVSSPGRQQTTQVTRTEYTEQRDPHFSGQKNEVYRDRDSAAGKRRGSQKRGRAGVTFAFTKALCMNQRVHGTRLDWGVLSVAALLLLASSQPVRAADEGTFSPQAVFALPDRSNIDSRCKDAIVFADKASRGADAILPDDAIAAANEFAACYRLPKINPDVDQQRYLMLAAAAALYLAATKTSGDEAAALYKKAASIATQLGAEAPDNTNGLKAVVHDNTKATGGAEDELSNAVSSVSAVGANGSTGTAKGSTQVTRTDYSDARNPHYSAQKLKFTEIATRLRASAESHLPPPPSAPPKPAV
jgi:hypothetical protein